MLLSRKGNTKNEKGLNLLKFKNGNRTDNEIKWL